MVLYRLSSTKRSSNDHHRKRLELDMTALGAAIYLGFFAVAALWLFLTADQDQAPDRSNSDSTAAGPEGSSPWLASHSASK